MSDNNHVDLSADFMMPTPWSSEDAGDTFDELLDRVRSNLHIGAEAQLQKIGTIADAYRLKVGKEMPNPAPEMPDNEMITFVKKQDKRSGIWKSQRFNGPARSNVKFGGSEGSGCLGMLLLILSAPISLLCLTIFMVARL